MSPPTRVVCDTTSYLPDELAEQSGLVTVALYVKLGSEQRRENEIRDLGEFYGRLRSAAAMPTTSQPSVGDFVDVYGPLLDEGAEIVSIHISSVLSGTYESALQAKARLTEEGRGGERILVMDSGTAGGGMGLVVLAAARAAAGGAGSEEVLALAKEARVSLKMWFAVDTLEYLRRGGRIGAASAWIGSTLKIKPILTFEHEVTPVERVRTRARAFERLLDYARQRHSDGFDGWIVQHIQADENAEALVAGCRDIFGCEPAFVSEVGPVVGAHVGPGLLGIGAIRRDLLG